MSKLNINFRVSKNSSIVDSSKSMFSERFCCVEMLNIRFRSQELSTCDS